MIEIEKEFTVAHHTIAYLPEKSTEARGGQDGDQRWRRSDCSGIRFDGKYTFAYMWMGVTWVSDVGCRIFSRWEGDEHHGNVS